MDKITERMAVVLQWILDDGEGGRYRGDIQAVLVAYNAERNAVPPGACPYCKGTGKGTWTMGNSHIATHCLYCRGTGKTA